MPFNRFRAWIAVLGWVALSETVVAQTNQSVELPVKLREGDLLVETRVNGSTPLSFKLDTGFGITTIHPSRIEPLKLTRVGSMTISGIAGDERAETYAGAEFDFNGKTYAPRRIAVLPSDAHRRRRHRDGILGAGFFRRFVVELDFNKPLMRLYEPEDFKYSGGGEIIPLLFKRDTPIVEASIVPLGRDAITASFEIDTGCDDCICLGHDFVIAHHLLESGNSPKGSVRRGVGGSAEIQHGNLTELRLGKQVVKKPSANFFLEGSPAGQGQAGHIGLGALQRFKVILDYSRRQIILE